ncbi:phenylalanine--tRNA ligase subunit alpha [Candidatus Woesearchaeota archaeon]|nr:phenylalanine--tRNA ligase subunit alpha [Candidatus Woesearchaeota archaeon]
MEMEKLIFSLTRMEIKVLSILKDNSSFESVVKASGLKEIEAMRALQWLENKDVVKLNQTSEEFIILDKNGKKYKKNDLPEKRFLKAIQKKEKKISEIKKDTDLDKNEINISIGVLRKKAAIDIKKEKELVVSITEQGKKILGKVSLEEKFLKKDFPIKLSELEPEEKFAYEELKKRKDILSVEEVKHKSAELTSLGKKLAKKDIKPEDFIEKLTPDTIRKGKYKEKKFRRYDVSINVPEIHGARRHFTKQAVEYIKRIWLDLGFKEMTGNLVQTGFWDLDSLFVPQDHPARDMQDTFYIKDPSKGKLPDKKLLKKIKNTHENGWSTGSLGWQSEYDTETAKENLLRTHTTVLSAQTINKLKKQDLPAKFFSVGKVFRNETLDWKHLFEFYQVEGIVVDPDVTMRHLIGYLKDFFKKMGFPDARVRPGHFPYTEPSMEVEVFHPIKKEWMEMGGSGIFRPEVTKPLMGFECPVLAWGLGMGRTITEYWDIHDIRELYKNDLKQLRDMKIFLK